MKLSELGKTTQGRRSRIRTVITSRERRQAFPAKFTGGTCPLCFHEITKGEKIFFRSGPKPMHIQCPPARRGDKYIKQSRSVRATG